jgi:hypothetical protein
LLVRWPQTDLERSRAGTFCSLTVVIIRAPYFLVQTSTRNGRTYRVIIC